LDPIPIVLEDGFIESWNLMLDDSIERSIVLLEWIKKHEGAQSLHHLKEFKVRR
jgi:hypothetical protein